MAVYQPKKYERPIKDDICWQSSLSDPGDRLAKLYNLSKLTDLTITFPGHTETLKAHRLILAMSSPVFERMLFGPLAEGEELKLPEDPPEAFKWLMKYIYHGTKELADVKLAVQVYHLASKYQMDALSSLCSEFLQTNLNASNLPLIYDTASVLGNSTLQKKCSEVVSKSAEAILSSPNIGQLSRRSMTHLLQQDFNVKSEVAVFQGLVKWGISQTDKESQQGCEGHNLRQEIQEFLPLVRFLTMTLEEFVKHVMPSNILTLEESTSILMNIQQVANIPVPPISSNSRERRIIFSMEMRRNVSISQHNIVAHRNRNSFYANSWDLPYTLEGHTLNSDITLKGNTLISGMSVTKDIYLGSITINNRKSRSGKITISNSNGTPLTNVESKYYTERGSSGSSSDDEDEYLERRFHSFDIYQGIVIRHYNSPRRVSPGYGILKASFNTPVLMTSNEKYDVLLDGYSGNQGAGEFSVNDDNLIIKGIVSNETKIKLYFWCLDDVSH